MLFFACGRQVWQAPDPASRAGSLQLAVKGMPGVFSVKTPRGQWFSAQEETLHPLAQCKEAYTSTTLLQLIDQGKAQLDDPLANYVSPAPELTLRGAIRDGSFVEQLVTLLGSDPWPEVAARQLFVPLQLTDTEVIDNAIHSSLADLMTFGHQLGEGSLLTAALHNERLGFTPREGYDGFGLGIGVLQGMLGIRGSGCAVFHDAAADVTIGMLFQEPLDVPATLGTLYAALQP